MTRIALFAAVVSASLLPLSAFAHSGGGGGGGHGGGGGGGHAGGSAHAGGGGHAGGHPAAHAAGHPHPHHHDGKPGDSSHLANASTNASHASGPHASRPGNPIGAKGSQFAKDHPRRNEVNHRVGDQRARIEQGLKNGTLTPAQAKQLAGNDRAIKQQEHADVKANGGFLTKSQQKQFNQEENANSRQIRSDEHPAATAKATAAPIAAGAVAGSRPGNPIGAPGSRFAEHHPRRDEVNSRVGDQRARIEQGLKNGTLTPAQAKQLAGNDNAIKQQEHADVKANGGYLTKSEQRQFNQEENANSRQIRSDEHPAATAKATAAPIAAGAVAGSRPGNPIGAPGSRFAEHHPRRDEVNSRVGDQRARIEQGLKNGTLTPAQAKQLAGNDNAIKQQEHADVKANGGYLTKSEQRQFNQEENANSRQIRNDEHPATP